MEFYIDENIPHQIAKALSILERDYKVYYLPDKFFPGVSDEVWIPELSKSESIVITQDLNIRKTRTQWSLFKESNLISIFIHAPSKNGFKYWDLAKLIIRNWEEIVNKSKKSTRPFAYKLTSKGTLEEFM